MPPMPPSLMRRIQITAIMKGRALNLPWIKSGMGSHSCRGGVDHPVLYGSFRASYFPSRVTVSVPKSYIFKRRRPICGRQLQTSPHLMSSPRDRAPNAPPVMKVPEDLVIFRDCFAGVCSRSLIWPECVHLPIWQIARPNVYANPSYSMGCSVIRICFYGFPLPRRARATTPKGHEF